MARGYFREFVFALLKIVVILEFCPCVIISLTVPREGEEMLEKREQQDLGDPKEPK